MTVSGKSVGICVGEEGVGETECGVSVGTSGGSAVIGGIEYQL